ncbi:MAG: hypothetical protein HXY37_19040 [Chloroflexi bacterium]|nr:hypothetical protein [Chloroflexota bacterium]
MVDAPPAQTTSEQLHAGIAPVLRLQVFERQVAQVGQGVAQVAVIELLGPRVDLLGVDLALEPARGEVLQAQTGGAEI